MPSFGACAEMNAPDGSPTVERTAIVTGASAGIGAAVTAELCRQGFAVTMAARTSSRIDDAARRLRSEGFDAEPVTLDVTEPDAAERLVAVHVERFGGLDVVVANAGWGTNGRAASAAPAAIERMVQTNLTSTFALAAAAVPVLRRTDARERPGWFIVTSSISGLWPTPGFAGYSATKAASISLARSIAAEEAERGVRACAICPAFVATDMTAWLKDELPSDEMLAADDVAGAVRFLLGLSQYASVTEMVLRRVGAPHAQAP